MRITTAHAGERLDRAIADTLQVDGIRASIREVRRALKDGIIIVDGRRCPPGNRAEAGMRVDLGSFVCRADARIAPDPALLARVTVLYEDDRLLALDKPSAISTAPLVDGESGTLLGAAVAHAPQIAECGPPLEGGLLHRLDFGTSGVVVFAKDAETRRTLRAAFSAHLIEKRYAALVHDPQGELRGDRVIDAPLSSGTTVKIAEDGQPASTAITVVRRRADGLVEVEARTSTGRRHQIRVHLASIGAPIFGDERYGIRDQAPRLALHAAAVSLPDGPTISAPPPADVFGDEASHK